MALGEGRGHHWKAYWR